MSCGKSCLILLLTTFLAFGFTAIVRADDGDHGIGCRIPGTYFVFIDAPGDEFDYNALLTLTDDGRVVVANQNGPFETAGYGNWEKVKARGMIGRTITFGFFPQGPPAAVVETTFEGDFDGRLDGIDFHGKCEYVELEYGVKVWFDPSVNPLETAVFPDIISQGTMTGQRIPAD